MFVPFRSANGGCRTEWVSQKDTLRLHRQAHESGLSLHDHAPVTLLRWHGGLVTEAVAQCKTLCFDTELAWQVQCFLLCQDQSDTFNDALSSRQDIHAVYGELNGHRAGNSCSIRHIREVD